MIRVRTEMPTHETAIFNSQSRSWAAVINEAQNAGLDLSRPFTVQVSRGVADFAQHTPREGAE